MIENTARLSTVPITVQVGLRVRSLLFPQTIAMAMLFAPERRLRTPARLSHQGAEPQQRVLTVDPDTVSMSGVLDLLQGPTVMELPPGKLQEWSLASLDPRNENGVRGLLRRCRCARRINQALCVRCASALRKLAEFAINKGMKPLHCGGCRSTMAVTNDQARPGRIPTNA